MSIIAYPATAIPTDDLDFLVSDLRLLIRDQTAPYKFTDLTLRQALYAAVRTLGRRWRFRYMLAEDGTISRNTNLTTFLEDEPPIIEFPDQEIILLQACIIMKSAEIYGSSWDVASWRDDEISYSNIQGAKTRDESIKRDIELLEKLLKQRLHPGRVQSLPGFHLDYNKNEGSL